MPRLMLWVQEVGGAGLLSQDVVSLATIANAGTINTADNGTPLRQYLICCRLEVSMGENRRDKACMSPNMAPRALAPGQRLNIKTNIKKRLSHVWGIPMSKIRRSRDRLIFNMGIPILVRRHLFIETAPWCAHTSLIRLPEQTYDFFWQGPL